MPEKRVEHKPSKTALAATLYRAVAHRELESRGFGPDGLAEGFLPGVLRFLIRFGWMRKKVINRTNLVMPGSYELMIARTAYFDRVFVKALEKRVPQVVLLGAGYDTRALRFAGQNRGTRVFELDIATTQNRERECFNKARLVIPEFLTFVPIDFDRESLGEVLEEAGCERQRETVFLWEGVTYYLDPKSVASTLDFIGTFPPESLIAFDYAASIPEEALEDNYGVREFTQSMKKVHPGEIFRFTLDEDDIAYFLRQRGLSLIEHLNPREIEETHLTDENGSLLGRMVGLFRFAVATPDRASSPGQ